VPHLGLDLVDPGERYSAGRYARDAAGWMIGLAPEVQPLVVGGTGFYIRALAEGLFREPPMEPGRRDRLREYLTSVQGLATWAVRLDAGFSGGGRQRAARAVEVALLSGRPLTWWQAHAKATGVLTPWYVRLTMPRALLRRRIAERAEAMLRDGLVEEVETVLARGVAPDAPGLDGVGYREVVQVLRGQLARGSLVEAIVRATTRYAKRQETWFRHQLPPETMTLDASGTPAALASEIAGAWGRVGG
jgi:tRNA dimethylallyltransferase